MTETTTLETNVVENIVEEMKELESLGIKIPHNKYDRKRIINFFGTLGKEVTEMGNRELSYMIDAYLMH